MNDKTTLVYKEMSSPVGRLKLVASNKGLAAISWEFEDFSRVKLDGPAEDNDHPTLLETERQLREYFAGTRKKFDIPFDFTGTEFQLKVWEALLTIPYGKTKSYGAIAKQVGDPMASRAVGGAVNKKPISIMIPCHRVIGASGKLVGFAGGLENKTCLLNIEMPVKQTTLDL